MRFVTLLLALISATMLAWPAHPPAEAARLRLLLRDASDAGVANVTLTLRAEDRQPLELVTNADGVALSAGVSGKALWLLGGHSADGRALAADSYPSGAGFRLVLLAGQVRDVLLRLDGNLIVLDPDMIFSPGDPGEIAPPTPAQLAATVAPLAAAPLSQPVAEPRSAPANPAAPQHGAGATEALQFVLALVIGGAALAACALMIGLARRRSR